MIFQKILKDKTGRIILSILWGLGLAALFAKTCNSRNCIIYTASNPITIGESIYKYNDKCYKYTPSTTQCTTDAIENNKQRKE